MTQQNRPGQPYHAHIYFDPSTWHAAEALSHGFRQSIESGHFPELLFVGSLKEGKAGPHPKSQFEVHFMAEIRTVICDAIRRSGLTALVHPLTDDDLADHTTLAEWIGEPLDLDLSTLDPPGRNQGVARFGKADF